MSERGDPPEAQTACDGLRRLANRFPDEVAPLLNAADDPAEVLCPIYDKLIAEMRPHGYGLIADVFEFIERWKPGATAQETPVQNGDQPDAAQPKCYKWGPDWACGKLGKVQDEIKLLARTVGTVSELLYSRAETTKPLAGMQQEAISTAGLLASVRDRMRGLIEPLGKERDGLWELHQREQHASADIRASDKTPAATVNLDDVCKHVDRIEKLVQAVTICVSRCKDANGGFDAVEFRDAISGSIGAARDELGILQVLLGGGAEGGAV